MAKSWASLMRSSAEPKNSKFNKNFKIKIWTNQWALRYDFTFFLRFLKKVAIKYFNTKNFVFNLISNNAYIFIATKWSDYHLQHIQTRSRLCQAGWWLGSDNSRCGVLIYFSWNLQIFFVFFKPPEIAKNQFAQDDYQPQAPSQCTVLQTGQTVLLDETGIIIFGNI